MIKIANGSAIDRPLAILVNGVLVNSNLSFLATPNCTTWVKSSISASFDAR